MTRTLAALGLVFLTTLPLEAANAMPPQNKIGIMPSLFYQGAEVTIALPETPYRFSAQAITMVGHSNWVSALGEYHHPLSEFASVGLHAGLSQSWFQIVPSAGATRDPVGPLQVLVGASYHHHFGPVALRLNPTLILTGLTPMPFQDNLIYGPPLLEIGYRFTPSFEVGLRSSLAPVSASWWF